MHRFRWTYPALLFSVLTLIFLAPAFADDNSAAGVTVAEVPSEAVRLISTQPCGDGPGTPFVFELPPELTTLEDAAKSTGVAAGSSMFFKTCRCSCGFPCSTDADCGPGGRCRGGITCCKASDLGDSGPADDLATGATDF